MGMSEYLSYLNAAKFDSPTAAAASAAGMPPAPLGLDQQSGLGSPFGDISGMLHMMGSPDSAGAAGSSNKADFFRSISKFRDQLEKELKRNPSFTELRRDPSSTMTTVPSNPLGDTTNEFLRQMGILQGGDSLPLDEGLSRTISQNLMQLNEHSQKLGLSNEQNLDELLKVIPDNTDNKYIETLQAVTDLHNSIQVQSLAAVGTPDPTGGPYLYNSKGEVVTIKLQPGNHEARMRRRERMQKLLAQRRLKAEADGKPTPAKKKPAGEASGKKRRREVGEAQQEKQDRERARQQRNRISAATSRQRQKDKMEELKATVTKLRGENDTLRMMITSPELEQLQSEQLQARNAQLTNEVFL